MPIGRHHGAWTEAHVRRLFWRAGFGATSEEARYWAARGKDQTIDWMMRGGAGPRPRFPSPTSNGRPLDPINTYGDDVLWWLDKMARTPRPLVEKMTLFWHDHFATLDQDRPLMLAQNNMMRRNALGSFRRMLRDVTKNPAMALFLSLADSAKDAPNENYARELMELFTLGTGYSERDIREASRALTGFRSKRRDDGSIVVLYDPEAHDATTKRIFGKRANFDWRDVLDLCLAHPEHAPFLVSKIWEYFVGTPIQPAARTRLVRIYRRSGLKVAPVVREVISHPAMYRRLDSPDMIKSPIVFLVGGLRSLGRGIDGSEYWTYLLGGMGQVPFSPPSVAGWEGGTYWLSSNTMHVRFDAVSMLLDNGDSVREGSTPKGQSPRAAIERARAAVGRPWTSSATDARLLELAGRLLDDDIGPDACQRALRHLLLAGPDAQVH